MIKRERERGREGEETFPLLYPAAAKESPNEGRGMLQSRGRERNAVRNGELSGERCRRSRALSVLP